jgi:hypothetical protein
MKRTPINATDDGNAFAIRTGYERHCYVGALNGGGHFPTTAVLEIFDICDA